VSITNDGDRDSASANDNGSPYGMGHSSGVAGFFAWWGQELTELAPQAMRNAFDSRKVIATVEELDGQVILKRKPGSPGKVLPADPRKAAANIPKAGVIYLLPEDGALRRERRLPSASRAHIHEIMNLQMASETPFTLDEVYTDSVVTDEDDATREINVVQVLAPRPAIDAIVGQMRAAYGIKLSGVDVVDPTSPSNRAGFNLLPIDEAAPAKKGWLSFNRILLIAVVAAAGFAAFSWRDMQARRIASADAIIAAAEGNASEAISANTQIKNGIGGIERLDAAQKDPLSFLRVYNTVAGLLPDGSWLEEFNYEAPLATVTGLSSNSATLVEAMESSGMVQSARFTAPIVTDPRSGAERFRLEITFKPVAGKGAAATGQEPQP
jgi:general secretion pathway protein L